MPLNKEAYIRYKIIDACIISKHKRFSSMLDLINVCEEKLGKKFTISTIQKDIKAMKEDELLGAKSPIKFSKQWNGYYYSDPDYSFHKIPLNDSDIEALKTATELYPFGEDIREHIINPKHEKQTDQLIDNHKYPFIGSTRLRFQFINGNATVIIHLHSN